MSKLQNRAIFKAVLPGLLAGGGCGAAVGLGYVPPLVGVLAGAGVGLYVGFLVMRIKRKFNSDQP